MSKQIVKVRERLTFLSKKDNLIKILVDVARSHWKTLAELNRQRLFIGEKASGEPISTKPYSPATIAAKKRKGNYIDNTIRLLDEGDFYQSIMPVIDGNVIKNKATDSKTTMLKTRYGDSIVGVHPEDAAYWLDNFVLPDFRKAIIAFLRKGT